MTENTPKLRWNKERVVALAGELADREGLGAVTLSRLADEMGVRPPSLFNHVPSLAGLLRELALAGTRALAERLEASGESLEGLMGAYRALVRAHPGLYAATLAIPRTQAFADPDLSEAEERIIGVCLRVAKGFGLEGPRAIHAVRAWRALAHGFSDLERLGGFGLPLDLDESYRLAVQNLGASNPDNGQPLLANG